VTSIEDGAHELAGELDVALARLAVRPAKRRNVSPLTIVRATFETWTVPAAVPSLFHSRQSVVLISTLKKSVPFTFTSSCPNVSSGIEIAVFMLRV
jgi:hypothetical protein